jgi:hypothetical protein
MKYHQLNTQIYNQKKINLGDKSMGLVSKAEKEIDLYFKAGNYMHPAVARLLIIALEKFINGGQLSGCTAEYVISIFENIRDYTDEDLEGEIRAAVDGVDILDEYKAVMKVLDMKVFNTNQLTLDQKREFLTHFVKLAAQLPLTPLLGTDDEWIDRSEMSSYPIWQNNRDSRVFKNRGGYLFYIDARAFEDEDGYWYCNRNSIGYFGGFPFTVPEKQYFAYKK